MTTLMCSVNTGSKSKIKTICEQKFDENDMKFKRTSNKSIKLRNMCFHLRFEVGNKKLSSF
jgi:hypothetical protein